MLNALVISNNINFIQALLNEINSNKLDIRISSIITDYSNVMELVNSSNFRVIFVDNSVPKSSAESFFKIYKSRILLLSLGNTARLIGPKSLKILESIISRNDLTKVKSRVSKELVYLGYKLKYKGTNYLTDSIAYIITNRNKALDNLQTEVYPVIAKKYGKNPNNIKSGINKATEYMYYECDIKVLRDYFGFCIDTKPTVKDVIFTVINKL